MIHLDRIQRRFGARIVFDGLSWLIPKEARYGLVGPNGAGKTTLLRLIAEEDLPDAGAIHRAGTVRIGYLPQEVETVGDGTVLETVQGGFAELRRMEAALADLERRMAEAGSESERLATAYGDLRHRFEAIGGDEVETRARAILSGLRVPVERFDEPLALLSGGWRMRVALARLLLAEPDLLLLDEPTNHLDLEAIDWLERFLDGWRGAFLVVSHDRYFLNRMVKEIVELDRGRLTEFPGGYDDYLLEREARLAAQEQAAKHQAREIAKVERFIERFRYKNTKAKQVQSRVKALEKIERIDAPSRTKKVRFGFPPAPRSGDIVLRAESVTKAYGDNAVFTSLDLLLRRAERVALVGPNGAGKSTLLKMAAGRVAPDGGLLEIGHNVTLQYYAQHQLEALDPSLTLIETLEQVAEAGQRQRLRTLLGSFLFSGDDVDKKVGVLSGGEKARLALARLLIRPSNLLLLDEPTNHLDLASREVLEDALDEYEGALVVISHDRYFINRVATTIAEVGGGAAVVFPGDYDTFLERHVPAETAMVEEAKKADPKKDAKRQEAEERNRRYRLRKSHEEKIGPVESEIDRLETRTRAIDTLQADPDLYRDPERAREIGREKVEIADRLTELYATWERLAAEEP
ncbi:MAG TPA: ABC-F family ATP-binding cassette domain-containing protein [Candidatus Polarisedimenticolaceae bacterium]|nr:ABC-F family ATP-binding cassette domain-containing protein [Candidatus Polarisedimenticolaceae bacterium]